MTLEIYAADRLDALALRMLDLAATARRMAEKSREENAQHFKLNDRKALGRISLVEEWFEEAEIRLHRCLMRERGRRQAAAELEHAVSNRSDPA